MSLYMNIYPPGVFFLLTVIGIRITRKDDYAHVPLVGMLHIVLIDG